MADIKEITVPPLLFPGKHADIDKAIEFKPKAMEQIKTHYGIYASQGLAGYQNPSNFTPIDMLYYHVYGDYRLSMTANPGDNAPPFLTTSKEFPTTVYRYSSCPPQNVKLAKNPTNLSILKPYLDTEPEYMDSLKGVIIGDDNSPLKTGHSKTEWFQRELAFKSAASKFHLPSLGTLAVSSMAIKNTAKQIGEMATEMIELMMTFIEDSLDDSRKTDENLPELLTKAFDLKVDPNIDRVNNESMLIYYLAKALVENPEYIKLAEDYPEMCPQKDAIWKACKAAYTQHSFEEAAHEFILKGSGLLKSPNFKYNLGMPVAILPGKMNDALKGYPHYNLKTDDEKVAIKQEAKIAEWIVTGARPTGGGGGGGGGKKKKGPKGKFDITADIDGERRVITDVLHDALNLRLITIEDEAIAEAAATKEQYLGNPVAIVFFRIFLDTLFTVEAFLYAATVKHKTWYLDDSIHISNKEAKVKPRYPELLHIIEGDFGKTKDKPGVLTHFAGLRATHTITNLVSLRALSPNTSSSIDEFYSQDWRLSELTWMAQALTDEGKAIYEREEPPNLLAQMQYRPDGAHPDVPQQATIKAKTVFYQIDSPILKDVIMKYDELYTGFTITNAFMPKDKKPKKGQQEQKEVDPKEAALRASELANAIWGSIDGRASDIVNREGVKPHLIFARLFDRIEEISMRSYTVADNYPSQWTGTNTVTKLRADPVILGEDLDMKYYSDRMSEYIKHLKGNYKSNPMVASTILTVLGNIVIEAEINVDSLRESFIARIKSDASRPMLKGTDIRFDAYRAALCVIRTEIDIPVSFREDFVAQKLDESQRLQIKDTFSDKSEPILLPESHPKYEKPTLDEDSESALFGTDNPHHLPHPDFYPKKDAILNLKHKSVSRFLNDIVNGQDFKPGDPLVPEFPNQGLQATFSGLLTDTELLELKRVLLDPETEYKVLPIDWIDPEHKQWDGRDGIRDEPNISVVTHYRGNLGILFEITPQGRSSFVLDMVPNRNLTNYDSILYRKYTGEGKHDTKYYVYTPKNKIFLNPYYKQEAPVIIPGMGYGPGVMGPQVKDESPLELSPKAPSLMIIRGDVSKLKMALTPEEVIVPEIEEPERPPLPPAPPIRDTSEDITMSFNEYLNQIADPNGIPRWW